MAKYHHDRDREGQIADCEPASPELEEYSREQHRIEDVVEPIQR
jgi:hypothetical protein